MLRAVHFIFAAAAICAACGSSAAPAGPLVIPDGCDPLLGGAACFLPYPSDSMRVADASTRTGFRIAPAPGAQFATTKGALADVHSAAVNDGFSLIPSIVASLPDSIAPTGLPSINGDALLSTQPASPTLLMEAATGTLLPHYSDLPTTILDDDGHPALTQPITIRAFAPLKPRTRYVVAIHHLHNASGGMASPAAGFQKLRDHSATEASLIAIRDRFEHDIFTPLAAAGIDRAGLQLAWDFTTGSEEEPKVDMLRVRELTLAWLKDNAPKVEVTSSAPGSGPTWRTLHGRIEGPLFVDKDALGARLVRGADGAVMQQGTASFDFSVHIPMSLQTDCRAGMAVGYGHGFFGGQGEMTDPTAGKISDALHAVTFGIDWLGMTKADREWLIDTIFDAPAQAPLFADRVHQAMANWMVTTEAIRRSLLDHPDLRRPESGPGACEGTPVAKGLLYSPDHVFYYGPSQGAILGATLTALDPNIERSVLNVDGSGFTHMMPRSQAFSALFVVVHFAFHQFMMDQVFSASLQRGLDRIDPATYGPNVLANAFPGSPPDRRVLLQVGMGDAAVPNLGAFLYARILGIPQTSPAPIPVFGVASAPPESLTSAMTLFDFGLGSNNPDSAPMPGNSVHDQLRTTEPALKQLNAFLQVGGTVIHPCEGPCKITPQ